MEAGRATTRPRPAPSPLGPPSSRAPLAPPPPRAGAPPPRARDGEDILDRQEEGLVDGPGGEGDVAVHRGHELEDGAAVGALAVPAAVLQRLERTAPDDGDLIPREAVVGEEFPERSWGLVEELGVFAHCNLIQEDDEVGDVDLPGE